MGTIIVTKGNLLAAYAKPNVPLPQRNKLTELIVQAELVLSLSRRNTDLFGEVKVAAIQHSILCIFIFPLDANTTLALATDGSAGKDYEQLTKAVIELLKEKLG